LGYDDDPVICPAYWNLLHLTSIKKTRKGIGKQACQKEIPGRNKEKRKKILDIESEDHRTRQGFRRTSRSIQKRLHKQKAARKEGEKEKNKKSSSGQRKETADCKPFITEITEQGIFLHLLPRHSY